MTDSNELEELRDEFQDQLVQGLNEFTHLLENSLNTNLSELLNFKGKLHTLKGAALSVQYQLCSQICHELETHLDQLEVDKHLSAEQIDLIYRYLDLLPDSMNPEHQDSVEKSLSELSPKKVSEKLDKKPERYDEQTLIDFGLSPPISPLNEHRRSLKNHQRLCVDFDLSQTQRETIQDVLFKFSMPMVEFPDLETFDQLIQQGLSTCCMFCSQKFFELHQAKLLKLDIPILVISHQQFSHLQSFRFSVLKPDMDLKHHLQAWLYRIFELNLGHVTREDLEGKLLLADDNAINLKVAVKTFEKFGFHVDTATNGEEALDLAMTNPYDFIILDLEMPICSGLQAAHLMKLNGIQTPVFAFSAHESQIIKNSVLDVAMDGWLTKPLKKTDLEKLLQKYHLQKID